MPGTDDEIRGGDSMGAVVRSELTGEQRVVVDLALNYEAAKRRGVIDDQVVRFVDQLKHLAKTSTADRGKAIAQVRDFVERKIPLLERLTEELKTERNRLRDEVGNLRQENLDLKSQLEKLKDDD